MKTQNNTTQILIVEDEILIADAIRRYLLKKQYQVSIARSYEEAKRLYQEKKPSLVLLDIQLNGTKSGIDFAYFMQSQAHSKPFIFLSSQLDRHSINQAKATFPAGYLPKPIQKESLYTTIEIALYNHQKKQEENEPCIRLSTGLKRFSVPVKDITYLQADHVYVKVHIAGQPPVLHRGALRDLLNQLPTQQFIQTHRSFAINLKMVNYWDQNNIYLPKRAIPVSRSRKKVIYPLLQRA